MRIELTALNPTTHCFRVVRDDGSVESIDLETRSYLVHDLTHYAVERTLKLTRGFYGLLASGTPMSELNDRTRPWPTGSELAHAESIVGPMQSRLTGKRVVLPEEWHFVADVDALYRRVWGQWRGTAFGKACVFDWP